MITTVANPDDEEEEMIPNAHNHLDKTPEMTWGDYMLAPHRPLSIRHREVARMAAHGKTTTEIAKALNYTESRVSVLRSNTKIINEIEVYRDKLFGVDAETRMKDLVPEAFAAIEGILRSDKVDVEKKEQAAKWVIEKVTGKPTQQVDARVEVSLGAVFEKLDKMKTIKSVQPKTASLPEADGQVIDVQAEEIVEEVETVELDKFASWLEDNI